ncbi:MAG: hypothetical protein KGZ89_03115 [Actinobacteria bacterium]|nr:hypothetical protein [Actinomycetota bacterium]
MMPGGELGLENVGALLLTLLLDPISDLAAALLLYAIIGTLLAILLVIAIMFVASGDDQEDEELEPDADQAVASPDLVVEEVNQDSPAPISAKKSYVPLRQRLASAGIFLLFFGGVWMVTGYTTSVSFVCTGCHVESVHTISDVAEDPHEGVTCVACHEPGGVLARVTTELPSRSLHIFGALTGFVDYDYYGRVTQSACRTCHSAEIAADTFNERRGIRMSHDEPLEAGAACLDCHTLYDGVVASHSAGMAPCLRCHNQVIASSDCAVCHEGDPAASASVPATFQPAALVQELRCGGCHNEVRDCDPCHGLRLPHSNEFKLYAHARQAAVDFWTGDGRLCQPCHTETRRPCTQCHGQMLGVGHPPSLMSDHQGADEAACDTCHQQWAYSAQRDFCLDVCHTEAAYRYSPR